MSSEDKKPEWKHDIPIDLFNDIVIKPIDKISKTYTMTSPDTADYYTVLHYGKKKIQTKADISDYFEISLAPYDDVIRLTDLGERAMENLESINKWKHKHAKELSEYKRLKKKFEGVV